MSEIDSNTREGFATDPGRLHVCTMLPRYIGFDLRQARDKIKRRLGMRELAALVPDAYRIPDSPIVKEATALVRELSDDMVLNHCHRTYAFGCIIAHQDRVKFDREVFYLGSIMHDLGVTEKYANEPGSFEWVGAKAAHEFCTHREYDIDKAALVHDAVALHSSVGIAHKRDPEIALVHFGAGVDVLGLRFEEIPKDALAVTLESYPRLDFKRAFSALLQHQADTKPDSHIAGPMGLGLIKRMTSALFSD
jgi:hypothetical protein